MINMGSVYITLEKRFCKSPSFRFEMSLQVIYLRRDRCLDWVFTRRVLSIRKNMHLFLSLSHTHTQTHTSSIKIASSMLLLPAKTDCISFTNYKITPYGIFNITCTKSSPSQKQNKTHLLYPMYLLLKSNGLPSLASLFDISKTPQKSPHATTERHGLSPHFSFFSKFLSDNVFTDENEQEGTPWHRPKEMRESGKVIVWREWRSCALWNHASVISRNQ